MQFIIVSLNYAKSSLKKYHLDGAYAFKMRYSVSLLFYLAEYYCEIVPQFVETVHCALSEPLLIFTSEKL